MPSLRGGALQAIGDNPSADLALTDDTTWVDVFTFAVGASAYRQVTIDVLYTVHADDDIEWQWLTTSTLTAYWGTTDTGGAATAHNTTRGWGTDGTIQLSRMIGYLAGGVSGGTFTFQARKQTNTQGNGTIHKESTIVAVLVS